MVCSIVMEKLSVGPTQSTTVQSRPMISCRPPGSRSRPSNLRWWSGSSPPSALHMLQSRTPLCALVWLGVEGAQTHIPSLFGPLPRTTGFVPLAIGTLRYSKSIPRSTWTGSSWRGTPLIAILPLVDLWAPAPRLLLFQTSQWLRLPAPVQRAVVRRRCAETPRARVR